MNIDYKHGYFEYFSKTSKNLQRSLTFLHDFLFLDCLIFISIATNTKLYIIYRSTHLDVSPDISYPTGRFDRFGRHRRIGQIQCL